jgi:hypothetical protein
MEEALSKVLWVKRGLLLYELALEVSKCLEVRLKVKMITCALFLCPEIMTLWHSFNFQELIFAFAGVMM